MDLTNKSFRPVEDKALHLTCRPLPASNDPKFDELVQTALNKLPPGQKPKIEHLKITWTWSHDEA